MRMKSDVRAKALNQYTVYAYSEEEAIQKLKSGQHQETISTIEIEIIDTDSDDLSSIEIVSCEGGTIS